MKIYNIIFLLSVGFIPVVYTMDSNLPVIEKKQLVIGLQEDLGPINVLPISEDAVARFLMEVKEQEEFRGTLQKTAGWTGAFLAATYTLPKIYNWGYDWLYTEKKKDGDKPQTTEELTNRVKTLEDELQRQKAIDDLKKKENAAKESWYDWAGNKLTNAGNFSLDSTKWFFHKLVVDRASLEIATVVFGVPFSKKAADYLFKSHTMIWFLEDRSQFVKAVDGLLRWSEGSVIAAQMGKQQDTRTLSLKVDFLARETEKVLGYMRYMVGQLDPNAENMKRMGGNAIAALKGNINELVELANHFNVQKNHDLEQQVMPMFVTIKVLLNQIVNQIRDFEVVQDVVGYEDVLGHGKNLYERLQDRINAGLQQEQPQQIDEEALREEQQAQIEAELFEHIQKMGLVEGIKSVLQ